MQFQAPPAATSHYQSRVVVSPPHNNQRYYSPLPPNIISTNTPLIRNQEKLNARLLSHNYNLNQIPQIKNNGNNFNHISDVDLNIHNHTYNNGTFNPA
jgi:hypothetical protein